MRVTYVAGAVLLYAGCLIGAASTATSPQQKLNMGLILGSILWIAVFPPHLFIQWLISTVLKRFARDRRPNLRAMALISPSVLWVAFAIISTVQTGGDRIEIFRRNVCSFVPPTLRITEIGTLRGIGESYLALGLEASAQDMEAVITNCGYRMEYHLDSTAAYEAFSARIKRLTGVAVKLDRHYEHYSLELNGKRKHIFFNRSRGKAYFWREG